MKFTYIIFNKPYGVLSQFTPEHGNRCLDEFDFPKDIYPAGRLDKDSEGILLLTNDGPFIKELLDPKNEKKKTYWVQVENIPSEESLQTLIKGVKIKNYLTKPCEAIVISPQPQIEPRDPPIRERKNIPTCWIEIKLIEGKNRQVRRMTAAIGHPTLRLIRVQTGKLPLNDLPPGKWMEVNKQDII